MLLLAVAAKQRAPLRYQCSARCAMARRSSAVLVLETDHSAPVEIQSFISCLRVFNALRSSSPAEFATRMWLRRGGWGATSEAMPHGAVLYPASSPPRSAGEQLDPPAVNINRTSCCRCLLRRGSTTTPSFVVLPARLFTAP